MIDDKTYTSEHYLACAHCAAPEHKYAGLLNVTSRDFSIHMSLTDTEETYSQVYMSKCWESNSLRTAYNYDFVLMVVYIKATVLLKFGPIQPYSNEIVIQLSALGEHQPAWKEFLAAHLMPCHIVAEPRNLGLIIRTRVLSQSTPTLSEASSCDLVSDGNNV